MTAKTQLNNLPEDGLKYYTVSMFSILPKFKIENI